MEYNEKCQPSEDGINWSKFESGFRKNELRDMTNQSNVRTDTMNIKI